MIKIIYNDEDEVVYNCRDFFRLHHLILLTITQRLRLLRSDGKDINR